MDTFNLTGSLGRNFVYFRILTKRNYKFMVLIYLFVEDVNSWVSGADESNENGATTKYNDFTVVRFHMVTCKHLHSQVICMTYLFTHI